MPWLIPDQRIVRALHHEAHHNLPAAQRWRPRSHFVSRVRYVALRLFAGVSLVCVQTAQATAQAATQSPVQNQPVRNVSIVVSDADSNRAD